jgi:valyl-tRNA synthetase
MINRHIKTEARKPVPEPEDGKSPDRHPRLGTLAFELVSEIRNFRSKAATVEERKVKTAERNSKYMGKRKESDEKKIKKAFTILQ